MSKNNILTMRLGETEFEIPRLPNVEHAFVRHIRNEDVTKAVEVLRELGLNYLRVARATHIYQEPNVTILQTTIGLSDEIPPDHFAIDHNDRLVINSAQGLSLDWDCDGDPVQIIMFKAQQYTEIEDRLFGVEYELPDEEEHAVIVKFPCTRICPTFKRIELPAPQFESFCPADFADVLAESKQKAEEGFDWEAAMTKTMSHANIGACTLRWWSFILKETVIALQTNSFDRIETMAKQIDTINRNAGYLI